MEYRRQFVPGAMYFFTVNIAQRERPLLTENIDAFRRAYRHGLKKRPVKTIALVVLPDHLHALWQLPPNDRDYAQRWRQIKVNFSRQIEQDEPISLSRQYKSERGIWQRRYWEHTIRDERDLQHHIEYIHNNPVKHGYVDEPTQWPYSSIHKHVDTYYKYRGVLSGFRSKTIPRT